MRLPLLALAGLLAGSPAVAGDTVASFVKEQVTVYDAPTAAVGREIPACAFGLPTDVLETSPMLRLRISSPDGPIWVSTSDVVIADSAAALTGPHVSRANSAVAGGTRTVGLDDRPTADSRSLMVGPDAHTPSALSPETTGSAPASSETAPCEYPAIASTH